MQYFILFIFNTFLLVSTHNYCNNSPYTISLTIPFNIQYSFVNITYIINMNHIMCKLIHINIHNLC